MRKPRGYTKMYYAVTLDPGPVVICHGKDRYDVGMKALEILGRKKDRRRRILWVATIPELTETIGREADRIIHWYFLKGGTLVKATRMNEH